MSNALLGRNATGADRRADSLEVDYYSKSFSTAAQREGGGSIQDEEEAGLQGE